MFKTMNLHPTQSSLYSASSSSSSVPSSDSNTPAKKFKCTYPGCTKSFSRSEHLHRHALNHKDGDQTCVRCSAHFRRRDLLGMIPFPLIFYLRTYYFPLYTSTTPRRIQFDKKRTQKHCKILTKTQTGTCSGIKKKMTLRAAKAKAFSRLANGSGRTRTGISLPLDGHRIRLNYSCAPAVMISIGIPIPLQPQPQHQLQYQHRVRIQIQTHTGTHQRSP
jgi:hypothetical protein